METSRYSRQILFVGNRNAGARKARRIFVVLVGCGALGSTIANCLIRAECRSPRVIDRDFLETTQPQRQLLFTEEEDVAAGLPKPSQHNIACKPSIPKSDRGASSAEF